MFDVINIHDEANAKFLAMVGPDYADDHFDLCEANPNEEVCLSAKADAETNAQVYDKHVAKFRVFCDQGETYICSRLGEEAALFQANLMVRAGRRGDYDEAAKIYGRFVETFDRLNYPDLSLKRIVKRLGRDKARVVGVDEATIDDAIRNWKRYSIEALVCPPGDKL